MISTKLACSIALAGSMMAAVIHSVMVQAAAPTDLRVYFKLDERLTRPLHMGERLVSPDVFDTAVEEGQRLTVEVQARILGQDVAATFAPEQRSGVSVSRRAGNRVLITARGCDLDSSLSVTAEGLSKQLSIRTFCDGDTIRAEISQ